MTVAGQGLAPPEGKHFAHKDRMERRVEGATPIAVAPNKACGLTPVL